MKPELVRLVLYSQDYLGAAEFAEVMGLSKQAFHQRLTRGHLLEPIARLKMGPVWTKKSIAEWLRRQQ